MRPRCKAQLAEAQTCGRWIREQLAVAADNAAAANRKTAASSACFFYSRLGFTANGDAFGTQIYFAPLGNEPGLCSFKAPSKLIDLNYFQDLNLTCVTKNN